MSRELFRVGPRHLQAELRPSAHDSHLGRVLRQSVCAVARNRLLEEGMLAGDDDVVFIKAFALGLEGFEERLAHGGGRFCGGCRLIRKSDLERYRESPGSVPWIVVKIRDDSGEPAVSILSPGQG